LLWEIPIKIRFTESTSRASVASRLLNRKKFLFDFGKRIQNVIHGLSSSSDFDVLPYKIKTFMLRRNFFFFSNYYVCLRVYTHTTRNRLELRLAQKRKVFIRARRDVFKSNVYKSNQPKRYRREHVKCIYIYKRYF
jgi:hypothetical protein